MTDTATIRPVARPRGVLSDEQMKRLELWMRGLVDAQMHYRAEVVRCLSEGASFSEVSKFTGLSTNTLQRWKREAGR